MEKIKYRGKIPSTGDKLEVLSIDWMHDEVYLDQQGDSSYTIDEVKLEMSSGMLDVNGDEIYEGDELVKIVDGVYISKHLPLESYMGTVELGLCSISIQGGYEIKAFHAGGEVLSTCEKYRLVK